jgi:hypothetical protein
MKNRIFRTGIKLTIKNLEIFDILDTLHDYEFQISSLIKYKHNDELQ